VESAFQKDTRVGGSIREWTRMTARGETRPGEFLTPRKALAARFGVGLSIIQEAIQTLSAIGMLEPRLGEASIRTTPCWSA
jgi:DNA-binding FadR family transcriptional regulator